MSRELLDRFVETDELLRGARAWRHTLAAAAVAFALTPLGGLWSAFVIGWLVLCTHGALLARTRRQLGRRLAATQVASDDDA